MLFYRITVNPNLPWQTNVLCQQTSEECSKKFLKAIQSFIPQFYGFTCKLEFNGFLWHFKITITPKTLETWTTPAKTRLELYVELCSLQWRQLFACRKNAVVPGTSWIRSRWHFDQNKLSTWLNSVFIQLNWVNIVIRWIVNGIAMRIYVNIGRDRSLVP